MKRFRVGIDSYSLSPLKLSPPAVLDWAAAHGAEGVQFSEINLAREQKLDDAYLADLADLANGLDLFIEWGAGQHIPYDTTTWRPRDLMPVNRLAAEQARKLGTRIIRSCSGGLMRWTEEAPPTEALLNEMAAALKPQVPMLVDLDVTLAIETHFEFTTFELLRVFDMCRVEPGGCLSICLDTMNLLTMLEDPVMATERVLPWVSCTHIKDGGMLMDDRGLVSFTAEIGAGLVDFAVILDRLATLDPLPSLSVEDHGGSFGIPIFDERFLRRFPDLTAGELASLLFIVRKNQQRTAEHRIEPLDRTDWPEACEQRMARGLANLQRLAAEASERAQDGNSP